MKQEKNPTKIVLLLGALALMVYFGSNAFVSNKPTNTDNTVTSTDNIEQNISITVTGSDQKVDSYSVTYKGEQSALQVLQRLQSENVSFTFVYQQYDFGAFVTGINGYIPDTKVEFWEFKINGQSSMVGISDYKVKPADKLEFALTKIDTNY